MDPRQFDALARACSAGVSRRRLLAVLLGGLWAAFGREWAARAQRDAGCAHFCNDVFPPGPQRAECQRQAARGEPGNLCTACGADPTKACPGATGTVACCGAGEACCGGECTRLSTFENCAACGDVCDPTNETCSAVGSGGDPESGCCARIYTVCDPAAAVDRCCNLSTCTGTNAEGQPVCCGVSGVSACLGVTESACCSGRCQFGECA